LSTNTSTITAISNDFDNNEIFSKQIEALGNKGDILVAISTSGNSKNIIQAIKKANEKHIAIITLTGKDGGAMLKENTSCNIHIPVHRTATIQEAHILVIHILCAMIDHHFQERKL